MAVRHLEVEVRREPGGAVLDLRGEINGFAEEALDAAYAEAETRDPATILLNFEEVDYINSTGIALIVGLLARARASKRDLLGLRPSDHYVEIFNITRLSDFVSVFPDEESALGEASPAWRRRGASRLAARSARRVRRSQGDKPGKEETMPQAQVTMDVRKVGDGVSVIDIKGELTGVRRGRPDGRLRPGQRRERARHSAELRGPGVHEQ